MSNVFIGAITSKKEIEEMRKFLKSGGSLRNDRAGYLIFILFIVYHKLLFHKMTLLVLIFSLSTVVMPIPFLRYFYVTFVILLISLFASQKSIFSEMTKISSSFLGIFFLLYNMALISLK